MLTKKILSGLIASVCFASVAYAQVEAPKVVDKATFTKIEEGLAKGKIKNPVPITEIRTTQLPGIYEVRFENNIIYSNAEGSYLLQGHLVDVEKGTSLTQERIDKLTAINFKDIPLKDAIVTVKGNGKNKLVVFEDPNCGYCKLFAKEVQKLNNVTIYTFLYPILGPDSVKKTTNVWCAKDKSKVWYDWMDKAIVPPDATCSTEAIDRNLAFGKKYNISGTPTILFEDGTKAPGVIKAEVVEERFKAIAAQPKKK